MRDGERRGVMREQSSHEQGEKSIRPQVVFFRKTTKQKTLRQDLVYLPTQTSRICRMNFYILPVLRLW